MKIFTASALPQLLALTLLLTACQPEATVPLQPQQTPQSLSNVNASAQTSLQPTQRQTQGTPSAQSQPTARRNPASNTQTSATVPKTPAVPVATKTPTVAPTAPAKTQTPVTVTPSPAATPKAVSGNATTEIVTSQNYNTETLVAGLRLDEERSAAEAIAKKYNLSIERYTASIKVVVFRTQGQSVPELLKALSSETALEYVEADQVASQKPKDEKAVDDDFQTKANANDTYFDQQYTLQAMNVPAAWDISKGKDIVVAVIDTGVDVDHADLKNQMVDGYDAFSQTEGPDAGDVSSLNYVVSSYKHGSHVAGVIAAEANNTKGIAGVAPEAKIMPIKIFADLSDIVKSLWEKEEDTSYTIISILADGIVWAADHGADVINMSLAVSEQSNTIDRAVKYALSKDISVIVAAGNDRHINNNRNYLAAIEGVIGVGATDENNEITFFSNSGDYVSVAAPGQDIISSVPSFLNFRSYVKMSGTSMAAPAVAGVAALMKAKFGAQATPAFIKQRLESTAVDKGDPGRDDYFGYGIVNAEAALN